MSPNPETPDTVPAVADPAAPGGEPAAPVQNDWWSQTPWY